MMEVDAPDLGDLLDKHTPDSMHFAERGTYITSRGPDHPGENHKAGKG